MDNSSKEKIPWKGDKSKMKLELSRVVQAFFFFTDTQ